MFFFSWRVISNCFWLPHKKSWKSEQEEPKREGGCLERLKSESPLLQRTIFIFLSIILFKYQLPFAFDAILFLFKARLQNCIILQGTPLYLTDPHMGDAFYIGMGVVAFFLASRPCHYQFFLSPSFSSIYIVLLLPRVRTTLSLQGPDLCWKLDFTLYFVSMVGPHSQTTIRETIKQKPSKVCLKKKSKALKVNSHWGIHFSLWAWPRSTM